MSFSLFVSLSLSQNNMNEITIVPTLPEYKQYKSIKKCVKHFCLVSKNIIDAHKIRNIDSILFDGFFTVLLSLYSYPSSNYS